jgi:hypothetical protein
MRPETHAFLARVRELHDPSGADEQRVLRALQVSIAAGAAGSAAATAASSARFGKLGAALGSVGTKLNVLLVCGAAALGTADTPSPPPAARALPAVRAASATAGEAARELDAAPPAPPAAPKNGAAPAAIRGERVGVGRAPQIQHERAASERVPSLRAEIALLREVQAALDRGDGASALRALDAHHTRDQVLLAERRAARILALCSLGRVDEARRAAVEFEAAHPRSVQRDVIARSCAIP